MRELSLFTGAGGGLLGTALLGWRPIGYVERDDYCQRVLAARIRDGYLPVAPIFGDVREFLESGAAAQYRGIADVVTGGFPCQPFSVAGKRLGADDERNMWPATIECIRVVRPRFCLLENVPGLLSSGYFGTILGDLAASGYDVRWRVLSAAELGAPHKRDRLWIVAHAHSNGRGTDNGRQFVSDQERNDSPHAARWEIEQSRIVYRGEDVPDSESEPTWGLPVGEEQTEPQSRVCGEDISDTDRWRIRGRQPRQGDSAEDDSRQCRVRVDDTERGWWTTEPRLGELAHGLAVGMDQFATDAEGNLARVASGVPDQVSQLRALGNGQVPAVVARAWQLLTAEKGR